MAVTFTDHVAHWPWRQERTGVETTLVVCGVVLYLGEVPNDAAEAEIMAKALDDLTEAAARWFESHGSD